MSATETRVQLATLIKELPVSKSSVFELLKNMGIERQRGHGPDGKNRVAWIAHDDAKSLTDAANQVANGSRQISDFVSIKTQSCNGHQLSMDRVQLNLRLPVSLVDELKAQAQWHGITLTALVEQQLAGEIDLPAPTALEQKDSELADLVDLVVSLKEDVEELQKWRKSQTPKKDRWVDDLRLQIKRQCGRGWIIDAVGKTKLNPNGKCRLSKIASDRSRTSVVLPFDWLPENAENILADAIHVQECFDAGVDMSLKDALASRWRGVASKGI